jgi:hypothetical protein
MPCGPYCIYVPGYPYSGNYTTGGTYDGYEYLTGDTSPVYYMYYLTGETKWCLSTILGDPGCVQFGPIGSTSLCPDFDPSFFNDSGICLTPTPTPTVNCSVLDFDSILDCLTPTPTNTPTPTVTPTLTPTPTETDVCGGFNIVLTVNSFTPTPTPTNTPTPTKTPEITRPCNFSGQVVFNTLDELMRCPNSSEFVNCFTGQKYTSTNLILTPFGLPPIVGYVYKMVINGNSICGIFNGLVDNIIGVDIIDIVSEIGPSSEGKCLSCTPEISQTPTQTPTNTPTPTPTPTPIVCNEYQVSNTIPFESSFTYRSCFTGELVTQQIGPNGFELVCSTTTPEGPTNISFDLTGIICSLVTPTPTPTRTVTPTVTPTLTQTPTLTPSSTPPPCWMLITVDTTITSMSSTAGNRFKFPDTPFWSNVTVEWGDGTTSIFSSGSHVPHIYPVGGIYQIKLYANSGGQLSGLNFNVGTNDEIKLLSIDSWCGFIPREDDSLFGAVNLNLPTTTDTPNIPLAISLGTIPLGGVWNIFEGTIVTNINLVGTWNVSGLGIIEWGAGGGPTSGINLTPSNYNSLLIGWASLGASLQSGVIFNAGTSQYNAIATSARNYLIFTKGWTITDGGLI